MSLILNFSKKGPEFWEYVEKSNYASKVISIFYTCILNRFNPSKELEREQIKEIKKENARLAALHPQSINSDSEKISRADIELMCAQKARIEEEILKVEQRLQSLKERNDEISKKIDLAQRFGQEEKQ